MIFIKNAILSFLALGTAFCVYEINSAYAHGNDIPSLSGGDKYSDEKKAARNAPKQPEVLSESSLAELLKEKTLPEDVILAKCHLGEMSLCRGFEIELIESASKKFIIANTGGTGVVGFEGLNPQKTYRLKLIHSKYGAEIDAAVGQVNNFVALLKKNKK